MSATVLVLSPHTDDGILGCGGAIAKMISEEDEVYYTVFSLAEKSTPGFTKEGLQQELFEATATLGIAQDHLLVFDTPVRSFPQHRQEILEAMINVQAKVSPDVVFLPSTADTHQDHQVISAEGFRAFKRTSMLGYELLWNNLSFVNNSFVVLSYDEVCKKAASLGVFVSQANRNYVSSEYVKSLASVHGIQIGVEYAEAFEVIRWIIR